MTREKLPIREINGLSDKECAEAVAQSFAAVSQEYVSLDRTKLPSFLPAGRPEKVNVFQVVEKIKNIGHTKSTLPLDLPDRLRKECALNLAEPMTDILNSCLLDGRFPIERKEVSKLLGAWFQEDGGWQTNTTQLCKKAYMR